MSNSKEPRQLLAKAVAAGWVHLGVTGSGHHQIEWPATGETVTFPTTATGRQLGLTVADIQRIGGRLTPRGRGRSREERRRDQDRRRERGHKLAQPVPVVGAPAVPDWRDKLRAEWPAPDTEEGSGG